MNQNEFIIVVAGRNLENWIETNISSILCQTYTNYTVIYINDASDDNTDKMFLELTKNNDKFIYIKHLERKNTRFEYIKNINKENAIVIELDGDDWFATEKVLENYNNFYNKHDCWITYGKMLVWKGDNDLTEANPQNTPYPEFVKQYNLYRNDVWRASHLRTYRKFLFSNLKKESMTSKINNKEFHHGGDLAEMYSLMEMCPPEKVLPVDFYSVVWNAHPSKMHLTRDREKNSNHIFEEEIRNNKKYKRIYSSQELKSELLPQVNVFGAFCETNSIPTKFSFCYNREFGDFDITTLHNTSILDFLDGKIHINTNKKIVAEITESPDILKIDNLIDTIYTNYKKFDLILTCNEKLLELPNAKFRNVGGEVVLNKNIHTKTYPELADDSLIKIYDKYEHISIITSNKLMCEGHRFRLNCLNTLIHNNTDIDIFGVGINPIKGKIDGLKNYRFSIAIENSVYNNLFTEKILDCFLTGTIPIYYGCPNIDKFFNTNGFYIFHTVEELLYIIKNLTPRDYYDKINIIKENFDKALQLRYNNDIYFDKYFKDLI